MPDGPDMCAQEWLTGKNLTLRYESQTIIALEPSPPLASLDEAVESFGDIPMKNPLICCVLGNKKARNFATESLLE